MMKRDAMALAKFLKEIASQLEMGMVTPEEGRARLADLFLPDEPNGDEPMAPCMACGRWGCYDGACVR